MSLAAPAGAQTAPRPSIEHSVDAICLKADVDGDDYRPYVCDPVCPLGDEIATLDASNTCKEPSPGDFHVRAEALSDASCLGRCSWVDSPCWDDSNCLPNLCNLLSHWCTLSPEPCMVNSDCPDVNNHCTTDSFGSQGVCVWPIPCTSNEECPQGWQCAFNSLNTTVTCRGVVPSCNPPSGQLPTAIVCDSVPEPPVLQLLGVSDDVTTPSAVDVTKSDASTTKINHGDAQECLAQIEAATGEPCSPGE